MKSRDKQLTVFLIIIGIISGVSVQFNRLAGESEKIGIELFSFYSTVSAIIFTIALYEIRKTICKIVFKSSLLPRVRELYPQYDVYTYTVFLLVLFGAIGVQFTFFLVMCIALLFLSLQLLLIYLLMSPADKNDIISSRGWLSFLFLISGFAALIYQIVWQRSLFTVFGVNIESVTVIVSIFMFGLGIGSLMGGLLSKKYPSLLPQFFLLFEILIGIFGIFSLPLIKMVSYAPVHNSLLKISLATFALLLFPTILMGATLPVLVAYLYKYYKNVGKSVGTLYFMNTIGSAVACFITANVLFILFGKQATILIAALCNFLVGFLVYRYTHGNVRETIPDNMRNVIQSASEGKSHPVRFLIVLLLAALTGYLSLSQEILWFRAISYTTGGKPDVFAHILGFFLFGIAFGALFAKKICENEKDYTLLYIALMLSLSAILYYFSIPLIGNLLTASETIGINALFLSVGIAAFLLGGIFPALSHFGIKSYTSVGLSLSWIYFANIAGSAAGPLFTGFVLLNSFTLEQNILYLSVMTLVLAAIIWSYSPLSPLLKRTFVGGVILSIATMVFFHTEIYSHILEKLHYKTAYLQKKPYKYVIQNRSGIITVESGLPDIVYGGGIYDGRINIDPVLNSNLITRAYLIAALHPTPQDVLEIGMSGGSWSRVMANHTSVKNLSIIEINPGYVNLIKQYPEIATILHDPKITIQIDDGRRWLNRNPDKKFDVIVMNTTFHWRDGITNLLSEEFLRLCKSHLKEGGILYYNMTFSKDVPFTAAQVFRHVALHRNLVIASDSPLAMNVEERKYNLMKFEHLGTPFFDKNNSSLQKVLEELSTVDLTDEAEIIRSMTGLWHITDDNMATEFKTAMYRSRWTNVYKSEMTWKNLIKMRIQH